MLSLTILVSSNSFLFAFLIIAAIAEKKIFLWLMFYLSCHSSQIIAFEPLQHTVEKVHRGVMLIVTFPSMITTIQYL
jgi:hypothetical protein